MKMAGKEDKVRHLSIQHEKKTIPAALHSPETGHLGVAVILTHGAGGDMDFPQLVTIARRLKDAGFTCLRFTCKGLNIIYRTKVYSTVLKYVHDHRDELGIRGAILAGRSMGSRAAAGTANLSYATELGHFVLGVVCLAYPLHPPNDTTKLRDSLLLEMNHPCLVVNGTSDGMCQQHLMRATILQAGKQDDTVKKYVTIDSQQDIDRHGNKDNGLITVYWIEESDHGYKVKGRSMADVIGEVATTVVDFCQKVQAAWPKAKEAPKENVEDADIGPNTKTNKITVVEDGQKRGTKRKRMK